ncbi:MAG: hypothetical protein P8Q36_06190 [Alphaproteobacteria bacterium]|jgi:hypothetical protein|nr:hypothetical protein [Rhodospirillaceae bacterium]MBT6509726.1 hypothetical protein [Rhodospirillaceae bacterium]MBT7612556.1 hypothetical protein [Rhodospirillaceae bacterium]MBT7645794.1 hypothetical protein [Rhodospirillaceae bacterium]MDG2480447.1 hypothetical protein [Alphaproteobacteria bacterium]
MPRIMVAAMAAFALSCVSVSANAGDEWPELIGVWTGTTEAVVIGDPLHHQPGEMPHLSMVALTITIEGQDGRRFWGTIASPDHTENLVGVIANDLHTLYFADSDGYAAIQLIRSDVMDQCYLHATADTQDAGCTTFLRTQ